MTAKHSTRKTTSARRFDTVDLSTEKSYTPIRTEDGEMEYELCYRGRFIGFAYEVEAARERLNEYAYDAERNRVEVADVAATAVATLPEAEADNAPLPFEPVPKSHRAYGPQVSWDCMPQAPISTLQDGVTVYGLYDTDDSHFCACTETAGGWGITADEHSVGINHHAHGINIDDLSPAAWASLKALVNSEAVEHLLTCGAAWDTYQDVPAKQPTTQQQKRRRFVARQFDNLIAEAATPAITIEQKIWPDIDDEVYTSTVYRYGQAEVLIHHDGVPENLTAYDLVVNQHNMDARDIQGIRDAAVLLADARVQAALAVIGLPVPSTPPVPCAPAVVMRRFESDPDSVGGGILRGTEFVCDVNDNAPMVWFSDAPDRNNPNDVPMFYDWDGNAMPLSKAQQLVAELPKVAALLNDPRVTQMQAADAQRAQAAQQAARKLAA